MTLKTTNLGFPRIGAHRELKKSLENYWNGKITEQSLLATASELRARHWQLQKEMGINHIPCNDFSLYDQMLDMAVTLGVVPLRYQLIEEPLARYFAMARGLQDKKSSQDVPALEMTKWFDTNYHYIVPELDPKQLFKLNTDKIFSELKEARALGIETRPVLIGPVTFLMLSKFSADADENASTLDFLDKILPAYENLFVLLAKEGVCWVQLDEPCLVLQLTDKETRIYEYALMKIQSWAARPRILIASYFENLDKNSTILMKSKCDAIHIDLIRGKDQLDSVLAQLPAQTILSLGVVDGRNIWRTDLDSAHQLVQRAVSILGKDRVWIAPSCSLLHVPVDLDLENKLDPELKSWLAFAKQKLSELTAIAETASELLPDTPIFKENRTIINSRKASPQIHSEAVKKRVHEINESMLSRISAYPKRRIKQQHSLVLPLFPTTTIGSFPQTHEVRKVRSEWRDGRISQEEYDAFLKEETRKCIKRQEELGLNVLVHGEFERPDMVEYFGEKLLGFAFTSNGWVQSYGSRCVKPPVIYGDVYRSHAMTVEWITFAQSLTQQPVKGMLTGPVTILQWSFVRDDQPREVTCKQIALALRDEVKDLEAAGIKLIQVDEPAIREGLPLRRSDWNTYLTWAVQSFLLATSGVCDETQIHTHMCYSEFGDILDSVVAMDADVLSIETSRSKMELLDDFKQFKYPNEVGPGVYDIHSPRVPSIEEIIDLAESAAKVVPVERLWINPDCGLKTRAWSEVETSLRHMTNAASELRQRFAKV